MKWLFLPHCELFGIDLKSFAERADKYPAIPVPLCSQDVAYRLDDYSHQFVRCDNLDSDFRHKAGHVFSTLVERGFAFLAAVVDELTDLYFLNTHFLQGCINLIQVGRSDDYFYHFHRSLPS
jgi:hypothetical protein